MVIGGQGSNKLILHQSCITEDQKYQGALYKDKAKRKSVTIAAPPKQAYVEDDQESGSQAVTIIPSVPRAPSPPPSATMAVPVDVFAYLVTEDTPNASRISLQTPKEQMQMVKNAQSLFTAKSPSPETDSDWTSDDIEYGADPVPTRVLTYETPVPKTMGHERNKSSTDKKRKRQVEELDLTQARRPSQELDEEMPDIDESGRPILHTGLTGGLNRMLTSSKFPPSPEYSAGSGPEPSPLSPAKRKRVTVAGTVVERRGRATNGQLVKVRKPRRASDESRPRKHQRSQKSTRDESKDRLKAIEYHRHPSPNPDPMNQLVVLKSRAEMFLSFITKGPESESGYSMNKALKRYHRERGERGMDKQEEEKELFKSLRLKKNDRGEIILMIGEEK